MKVFIVAGARPNFIKIAPIMKALKKYPDFFETTLVHTGQHYDYKMSEIFFEELKIDPPDIFLETGSGSHAEQTARIMTRFEPIVEKEKPDLIVVVGDVNSTLSCAITAKKCQTLLAHVEAGLRSFDRRMPEEINRIVTDSISDICFTTTRNANRQLVREGHHDDEIQFVGNCMIDTLSVILPKADMSDILTRLGLKEKQYALMTMHRPSNVDDPETLNGIIKAVDYLQQRIPVVYPIHPRTKKNLEKFELEDKVYGMEQFLIIEPQGYLDFIKLMKHATLIITDSGGLQEETTYLQVPCLTLRENTERPVTTEVGSNIIVGTHPKKIKHHIDLISDGKIKKGAIPELWDGNAAERISQYLLDRFRAT